MCEAGTAQGRSEAWCVRRLCATGRAPIRAQRSHLAQIEAPVRGLCAALWYLNSECASLQSRFQVGSGVARSPDARDGVEKQWCATAEARWSSKNKTHMQHQGPAAHGLGKEDEL